MIKEIGGARVAVIGQAFPYVPIAHPKRFTPDWTFGIHDDELQKLVDRLRTTDKVDAVLLLSHNGMDVDLKLASRVSGIDVILGGHTHDAVPEPIRWPMPAAPRLSPTPARTENSSEYSISTSERAGSATSATGCCRCSRNC